MGLCRYERKRLFMAFQGSPGFNYDFSALGVFRGAFHLAGGPGKFCLNWVGFAAEAAHLL